MPTMTRLPGKIIRSPDNIKQSCIESLHATGNTCVFNVTGHPALTLNCGYSENVGEGEENCGRFPVGMMLVGRHWDETTVLNVASVLEEIFNS